MNIFKMVAVTISMMAILGSPMVNAKDGQGTIEEIIACGAGGPNSGGWKQNLLFKLSDGNWFGVNADYISPTASDYDSNLSVSMVLMAFASKLPVSVRFTNTVGTNCGVTANFEWSKKDDYIKIAR